MVKAMLQKLTRGALYAQVRTIVSNFRLNKQGNVAVITALAALPMIAAVGCVIDYTTASSIKTKLQAAADAASLATVSVNSSAVTAAQGMSANGTVSGGSTFATNFFNANLATIPQDVGYTTLTPTATVSLSGTTVTAVVSFTAQVPTYFLGILGYKNIPVSGTSTASYSFPTYINFYLMLDVSGSMSFPSTTAEQARLQAVNPDNLNGSLGYPTGCTFACHFTTQGTCGQTSSSNPYQGSIPAAGKPTNPGSGGYCQGFIITRLGTTPTSFAANTNNTTNGNNVNWSNTQVTSCPVAGTTSCIQLRADAVGYAVTQLLSTASNSELVTNQFQVGLYPFIQNLYTYVAVTSNLTGSINTSAANLASLLDTGVNTSLGSGGTHFENALSSMNSLISSVGTGRSASTPLPYVFLITDGSQDYQTQSGGNWGSQNWSANSTVPYQNSATVIPPNTVTTTDYCTTMKKRGITIAVLYIPYQTIQNANANFANNEDGYANKNIANIPAALKTCASTNFFYTANTPADINNALIAMFDQAVSTAHLSN
jgi:Flp pilus assembly protein TadG